MNAADLNLTVETLRRAVTLLNTEAGASGMQWEDVQVCDQFWAAICALESGEPLDDLDAMLTHARRVIVVLGGDW